MSVPSLGIHGDADAAGDEELRALHDDRLGKRRDQAARDAGGVGRLVHVAQHHDELVATETRDAVRALDARAAADRNPAREASPRAGR